MDDPVLSSVLKIPQNCFCDIFLENFIFFCTFSQTVRIFFGTRELQALVLAVGLGQPRVDDLIVVVHPLDVGLRALDGLLNLAFGGAQAVLVIFLEPF
jgi:hypothetical protein